MSEFGGLRKHDKTHHALEFVGVSSAALAAAVALVIIIIIKNFNRPPKRRKLRGMNNSKLNV